MTWNVGTKLSTRHRPWVAQWASWRPPADDIGSLRLRRAPDPDGLSSQRANPVVRWKTLDLRPCCPCVQPGNETAGKSGIGWPFLDQVWSRRRRIPRVSTNASIPSRSPSAPGRAQKGAANLPFPAKYASETTSDLKVTVRPGENDLEPIKLLSGPAAAKSASRKGLNR